MNIGKRVRVALAATVGVLVVATALTAQPASAADLPINLSGQVKSHIDAAVDSDVVFAATFNGGADVAAGTISGDFAAEPSTLEFKALGLIPVKAGTKLNFTQPVSGTVDLATLRVDVTATFNIELTSFKAVGLPLLDPFRTCRTTTPISANLTGTFDPVAGIVLTGTYTIPAFKDCGLATPFITLFTSGPGNTIDATLANV